MKFITSLLLCFVLVFSAATAQQFEGTYEALVTTQKKGKTPEKTDLKLFFKDKKIRIDMSNVTDKNARPMQMFFDLADSTMVMIMNLEGSNSGMRMKINKNAAGVGAFAKADSENAKFTKTTETKTINGRTATKMVVETEEAIEEFWVVQNMGVSSKEFTNLLSDPAGTLKKYKQLYAELEKSSGMPMEVKITQKKSGDVTLVEVRNFKKEAVSNTVFDLSSYNIMDLGTR